MKAAQNKNAGAKTIACAIWAVLGLGNVLGFLLMCLIAHSLALDLWEGMASASMALLGILFAYLAKRWKVPGPWRILILVGTAGNVGVVLLFSLAVLSLLFFF